jgi:hypothetical protein
MFAIFVILSLLAFESYSASANPTWVLTNGIKSGTSTLFTTLKPPGTDQSFNCNYPSFFMPPSTLPFLVYGIQKYRGIFDKT